MEALPGRTCVPVLSYAQQRWYDPRTGRFLSEDPVGATDERLAQPGRMHAFAYGAGNPLLWTDPLGLDVGQPESTSARAQEDMRYQAGRNDNNKDQGNWAQGCAAGLADNWKNLDGGAMEAGNHSPEYLAGYVRCQGANLDSYRNSAIAKNTREFWTATPERAGAMGCVLGGGSALSPVGGDVNNLPSNMQSSAAACQFGVGAATAVMTAGELGVSGYRALKNFRPPTGPAPAFAGISNEARSVAAAEEASAAERMPTGFEARARGGEGAQPGTGAAAARSKPVNLPSWKKVAVDMEHVASGHMAGGSRVSKLKDLFPSHMNEAQVEKAIREAYRNAERVQTQGPRVLVRGTHEGLNVEMWVNTETKVIETAYPRY
jgi:RHS repeat-associated protein